MFKNLSYSTHLNGPHVDFYDMPFSFNKFNTSDNITKFQRKIVKSMSNLLLCEKHDLYLSSEIIQQMIKQINIIKNESYWKNYGFTDQEIINIMKIYQMYYLFLETYSAKVNNMNNIHCNNKYYEWCIKKSFKMKIKPNFLQKFGIIKTKRLINKIKKTTGLDFFSALEKYKSSLTKFQSDTELTSKAMTCVFNLHQKIKSFFGDNSEIVIPEPHKIKVVPINSLLSEYCGDGFSSGKYLFLNVQKLENYYEEHLDLLCANYIMPGYTMLESNFTGSKFIDALNKGSAIYLTDIILGNQVNKLTYYFTQLLNSVKIIIDTALNSSDVAFQTDIAGAKTLMKKLTYLNDNMIESEILKCLAYPAEQSSFCFGYHLILKLKSKMTNDAISELDFCKHLYKQLYKHSHNNSNKKTMPGNFSNNSI